MRATCLNRLSSWFLGAHISTEQWNWKVRLNFQTFYSSLWCCSCWLFWGFEFSNAEVFFGSLFHAVLARSLSRCETVRRFFCERKGKQFVKGAEERKRKRTYEQEGGKARPDLWCSRCKSHSIFLYSSKHELNYSQYQVIFKSVSIGHSVMNMFIITPKAIWHSKISQFNLSVLQKSGRDGKREERSSIRQRDLYFFPHRIH